MSLLDNPLCSCGCGNHMPDTLVRRGWRHLRGHGITLVTNRQHKHPEPAAPRPGPVTGMSQAGVSSFLVQNINLQADQIRTALQRIAESALELQRWTDFHLAAVTELRRYFGALDLLDPKAIPAETREQMRALLETGEAA